MLLLAAALLLLAACGPAQAASNDDQLRAETARIAQQFQSDQDLATARTALDGLEVANPRQWLMLQTEDLIASGTDPALAAVLVELTNALDIQSAAIRTYAAQQGLAEPTPTFELAPVEPVVVQSEAGSAAQASTGAAAAEAAPVSAPAPTAAPTAIALAALPTATPQPTEPTTPQGKSTGLINVRSGPGTEFGTVAALNPDEAVDIVGKNPAGDWWQVTVANGATGWVFGQLLTTSGDVSAVAVASDIPTPPPAAEPAVVAKPAEVQPTPTAPPGDAAPEATATTSPDAEPYFRLASSRMWSKEENGACAGQHLLRINVIDANGVRINGVRLQGIYTGEILVTGSQGKGDGVIEYDLYGTGEGFRVIQNDDGRSASSDNAEGFTTKSLDIPVPTLIQGGYCTNDADCQVFYNSYGCTGHHSWEATFQRNY